MVDIHIQKYILIYTFTDGKYLHIYIWDFLGGSVVKNSPANAGNMGAIPWVRTIPWRRKWQPTPVFSPGKSH